MKKNIMITIFVLILLIVLFMPVPTGAYKDGGTSTYTALTYKIVNWNKLIGENDIYKKTSVYWLPNNFKSIDELCKIENINKNDNTDSTLVLQTYNNKGLTFILNNETSKEYIYGEDYKLFIFKDNEWTFVPYINNAAFNSVGYTLKKHSFTEKIDVNWVWSYGELPDGKYKFEKEVLLSESPGDYDSFIVSEEFELVDSEAVKVLSYTLSKLNKDNKVLVEKDFLSENDMKIISAVYFDSIIKSSMVQIDLSNVNDFYNVKTSYSNGESSNAVFCFESDKAYMIFSKEEVFSSSMRTVVPVNNELYQKMIKLLK